MNSKWSWLLATTAVYGALSADRFMLFPLRPTAAGTL